MQKNLRQRTIDNNQLISSMEELATYCDELEEEKENLEIKIQELSEKSI